MIRIVRSDRARKRLLLAVASVLAILGLQAGARAVSRRFVFRGKGAVAAPTPPDVRERIVIAADGAPVHTLELLGSLPGPVLVHFHNNRETVTDALPFARALRARGVGVVLVEYRGYGASIGFEPSEDALYLDAEAVLDDLMRRGMSDVVLSGASLGTGVAAEMARRGHGSALVLMAPYTSIPDLVEDVAPIIPAGQLVADRFATIDKAAAIGLPTLVVHGDADEVVPFWMGAAVAHAIPGARLMSIPGGRHHDLIGREPARIVDAIVALTRR